MLLIYSCILINESTGNLINNQIQIQKIKCSTRDTLEANSLKEGTTEGMRQMEDLAHLRPPALSASLAMTKEDAVDRSRMLIVAIASIVNSGSTHMNSLTLASVRDITRFLSQERSTGLAPSTAHFYLRRT